MRRLTLTLAAAALLVGTAALQTKAQTYGPILPANDQADCTEWTRKLETGLQVIAASPGSMASAKKSLDAAKAAQSAGKFYSCAQSAAAGMRSLDAG